MPEHYGATGQHGVMGMDGTFKPDDVANIERMIDQAAMKDPRVLAAELMAQRANDPNKEQTAQEAFLNAIAAKLRHDPSLTRTPQVGPNVTDWWAEKRAFSGQPASNDPKQPVRMPGREASPQAVRNGRVIADRGKTNGRRA